MVIERLIERDADRLRAVRLRALEDAPDAFGSTHAEALTRGRDNWAAQLRNLATFVAVRDGVDVGMARGGPDHDRPGTAFLLSMWVAPEARGLGAGGALIDAIIAWARGAGFERLVLDVGDHNRAAIALYQRKGFEPTGVTGSLPAPREHVREHERALELTTDAS